MKLRKRLLSGAVITIALPVTMTGLAAAQSGPPQQPSAQLSEIVVTARKREESLQSVPVAVTTQTGAQLQQQRISQPTDLGRIVPSLQIRNSSGSGNSGQISLRGQSASDSLLGISQPVGLYQDTVNIPHPFGANNGFLDIQRVEVLKGPQGTLYGRNTTGGAINIITRNPDYDGIHGFVEGEVGDYKDWRVTAAVNVPVIADKLAVRLAYQHWNRQGFGKSVVTGQHFGDDHKDDTIRVSVRFDPFENLTGSLKLEYSKADHNGAMLANRSILPPVDDLTRPIFVSAANNQIFVPSNSAYVSAAVAANPAANGALLLQSFGGNRAAFDQLLATGRTLLAPCIGGSIYENCSATHQFDNLKSWHGVLDWSWDINDYVRLRSITGVHAFTNTKVFDLDGVQPQVLEVGYANNGLALPPTAGNVALPYNLPPDQQSQQWSQEFNLTGNAFDKHLSWLVGAYASWDKGKGSQQAGALEELTSLQFGHAGLRNTTDTWALFTQNDVKFNDVFSITFGARYTEEKIGQDLADWNYSIRTGLFTCNGAVLVNGALVPLAGATAWAPSDPHNFETCARDIRATGPGNLFTRAKSNGISYLLSFNFQLTPDKLLYVKTARGFRGGAFGRAAQIPASPETDVDYEVGFKADWLQHRLRTNIAAYQTNYDNKQVSSLVPVPGGAFTTLLLNAATARIRGAEVEFQAVPFEGLSVFGTASWNEAVYTNWPNATTIDGVPLSSAGVPSGNAAGISIIIPPYGTPPWQGSVGARYEMPVAGGTGAAQLDYSYRGSLPLTPVNNQGLVPDAVERDMNRAVGLLNARLEYKREDLGLTGSVWVTNLTDEKYGYEGISAGFTAGISHLVVQAPRMWGVTVRKTFGGE
jgi:iron complex outermembrane receptor protein